MKENGFKKITLKDKIIIEKYINETSKTIKNSFMSGWNFSEICLFKEIVSKYKIINDYLCIKSNYLENDYFYPPFGSFHEENFYKTILEISKNCNNKLKFSFIPLEMINLFTKLVPDFKITIDYNQGESDYIYKLNDFKKCIRKRRLKNFIEKYNPNFEKINSLNKHLCFKIQKAFWCNKKRCNGECEYCSYYFLKNILDNFEYLNFEGIIIKNNLDDTLFGFCIIIKNEPYLTFYELKSDHISGLNFYIFETIINLFCKNINVINFTHDGNIKTLKEYKRHLCKYSFLNKYNIELAHY